MSNACNGVYPAIITPFNGDGSEVDYKGLEALVVEMLEAGVHGIVVCGSTGESLTLSDVEYASVVRFVVERCKGKVPVIGGISQSATARAVSAALTLKECGCDGILVATPPYNKPSQQGISVHLREIRATSGLPVMAYNIPGRSGASILPSTIAALVKEGVIMGVKESSGSLDTVLDVLGKVSPEECSVVSGEDSFTLALLVHGGSGVISACANAMPREFVRLYESCSRGDIATAKSVQMGMLARIRSLFVESNPVPVKYALYKQGIIAHDTVRAPLTPLSESSKLVVDAAFDGFAER